MDAQYEVCRLTCGWKHSWTFACFVARTVVLVLSDFMIFNGKQKDWRSWFVYFSHLLVQKWISAGIIASSLEKETIDVPSFFGLH